jgi:tetratricopeptide (TPR) repeat protein
MFYRVAGFLFFSVGFGWFVAIPGSSIPNHLTVEHLKKQTQAAIEFNALEKAITLASEGLQIAPLDWELYYQRGFAEAFSYRSRGDIERDFAAARYLLPNWPDLAVKEGEVWLNVGEADLAFATWEDSIRRWPENAVVIYQSIFPLVRDDADLRDHWRKLGETNRRCFAILLPSLNRVEFAVELEKILSDDPTLESFSEEELKGIFSSWYNVGDKLALAKTLKEHPAWQKIAWRELGRAYADYGDYQPAYETFIQHMEKPSLPEPPAGESMEALASRVRMGRATEQEGIALAVLQAKQNQTDDAFATLKTLSERHAASRLISFVESELHASRRDWQKAWTALWSYAKE